MPFNSRNWGSKKTADVAGAYGLAGIGIHVINCYSKSRKMAQNVLGDVAGTNRPALPKL
jgi:hypothetical protein